MKKISLISILTLASACGIDPNSQNTNNQSTVDATGTPHTAMLVGSAKNMPACTSDLEGQLIYVKDVASFYFCNEKEKWESIDVSGKDGQDGKDGKDGQNGVDGKSVAGENGKDGKDGVDGTNGVNGVNGKDAPVVDSYSWIHPVTGDKWFVGNSIIAIYYSGNTPNLLDENYICPAGSHSPEETEYLDALAAGIWYKFQSYGPLLIGLGAINNSVNYQYGPNLSTGIQSFYRLRVAANANGVTDLIPATATSYVSAKALCVVD